MGEMMLSAIISFIVDTFGNYFFNKKLNKKVSEKVAIDSKIAYIQKTENNADHNQSNENVINNNIIGNNNNTINYNQSIQVINEQNISYSNGSTGGTEPLSMFILYIVVTVVIACGFFWLKNNIPHYLMVCFFIFIFGLILNKIYSYIQIKKDPYLFFEKEKYMMFSVVLLFVMILVYSNIFDPQAFLQIEEGVKGITNIKMLGEYLISLNNFSFIAYYSMKNIFQILIAIVPLVDVILSIWKKKSTTLLMINSSNFILILLLYFIAFYLPKVIFYFS